MKRVRGGGGAMSKKRLREKRKLTLDIPSETPGYKLCVVLAAPHFRWGL